MLLDRLLEQARNNKHIETLRPILEMAELIIGDNISKYLYQDNPQEDWDLEKDFPNVAPPFPVMFLEWPMPRQIISDKHGLLDQTGIPIKRYGLLVISQEVNDIELPSGDEAGRAYLAALVATQGYRGLGIPDVVRNTSTEELWDILPREIKRHLVDKANAAKEIGKENLFGGVKWVSEGILFIEFSWGIELACNLKWGVYADGSPHIPDGKVPVGLYDERLGGLSSPDLTGLGTALTTMLFVPFLTLSFMHCKNVILRQVTYPLKLDKARLRRGKRPLITYRVVEVYPVRKILESEGRANKVGLKQALHICRGHFKDYMEGGGLFGKIHGIFWWDAHTRGDAKVGMSVKDYEVFANLKKKS